MSNKLPAEAGSPALAKWGHLHLSSVMIANAVPYGL